MDVPSLTWVRSATVQGIVMCYPVFFLKINMRHILLFTLHVQKRQKNYPWRSSFLISVHPALLDTNKKQNETKYVRPFSTIISGSQMSHHESLVDFIREKSKRGAILQFRYTLIFIFPCMIQTSGTHLKNTTQYSLVFNAAIYSFSSMIYLSIFLKLLVLEWASLIFSLPSQLLKQKLFRYFGDIFGVKQNGK